MLKKFFEIAKKAKEAVFITTEGLYVDNKNFKMLLPLKEKVNPDYIGYISADNIKSIKPSSIKATENVLSVQGGFITTDLNNVINYEVDSKQKVKVKFETIDEKCCVNIPPSFTEFIKQAAPFCTNEKEAYRKELQYVCVSLDNGTKGQTIEIKGSDGCRVYKFETEIQNELQYVGDYGIPSAIASKLKDASIKANERCMNIVDGSGLIIQTERLCKYVDTHTCFDMVVLNYHANFEIMERQMKEFQAVLKSAVKGDRVTLYESNGSLEYIIENNEGNVKSFGKIDVVFNIENTNHTATYNAVFLREALNTYGNCAVNVKANNKSMLLLIDDKCGKQNLVLPIKSYHTVEEVKRMVYNVNGITENNSVVENIAENTKAVESVTADNTTEPAFSFSFTLHWSESWIFEGFIEKYPNSSFALINAVMNYLDEKQDVEKHIKGATHLWYHKVKYTINAVVDGKEIEYQDRCDLGDKVGGLLGTISDKTLVKALQEHSTLTEEEEKILEDLKNKYPIITESVTAEPVTENTESVTAEPETVNTEGTENTEKAEETAETDEIKELINKYNIRVVKGDTLKADLNGLTAKEFKETVASRKAEILAYLNPTIEF